MSPFDILMLIFGTILLIGGAEALVRGGVALALRLGVSALIIGLTVVAYGTSSPELVVSLKGVLSGRSDVAVGNVVGSNIFNVLFIIGLSALINPLTVSRQILRLDVPVMVVLSCLTLILSIDGRLNSLDGIVLLGVFVIYTGLLIRAGKKDVSSEEQTQEVRGNERRSWVKAGFLILAGLSLLVAGAHLFVEGAVGLARFLGLSDLVISLTVVAAGTSLPEAATSIVASFRGQKDIVVGNVIGSNIFNILAILGISSLVSGQEGIPVSSATAGFDMVVMIASAIACMPFFFTEKKICRWEGAILLFYYGVYVSYLVLKASQHDSLPFLNWAFWGIALPLTFLTMTVLLWWSHKKRGVTK